MTSTWNVTVCVAGEDGKNTAVSSYSLQTLRPALSVTAAEREQLRVIAMDARDRIARLLEASHAAEKKVIYG